MTHGWPGSIVEFHKVIAPLTDPTAHGGERGRRLPRGLPVAARLRLLRQADAPRAGASRRSPTVWDALMTRLGYTRYVAQGGDWGSIVTTAIGMQNRGHCVGIHVNMPIAGAHPGAMANPTDARAAGARRRRSTTASGIPATRSSSRRGRRRSATAWSTRRPARRRGSSRSSGRGPTATATRRTR